MSRRAADGLLRSRLTAQLLAGPRPRDPVAAVERLLAVQGQDPRGARLAVRARTEGTSVADFERALSDERSLVIGWLNRGTLHLVRSEDYGWLRELTAPTPAKANARRLAQLGVDPGAVERAVVVVRSSLAEEGPLTRGQLAERLQRAGIRTEGQILVHLLAAACLRGVAVRGPLVDGEHAYVLVDEWLGRPKPVKRERGLAELARRYLAGHGPADDRDLAKWAGLPLRDARAGLTAIASALEQREDGQVDLAGRSPAADLPPPRLLGAFDPVLLGWSSRELVLGPHAERITVGGMVRPVALVAGRAAGIWRMPGGRVELETLARLSREDRAALAADAREVERFLGARGADAASG
jgi:hypothetical protein